MLETQLWSLSSSCRRLLDEVEGLMKQLDPAGEDLLREVSRHLETASNLVTAALDDQKKPKPQPGDFLQLGSGGPLEALRALGRLLRYAVLLLEGSGRIRVGA